MDKIRAFQFLLIVTLFISNSINSQECNYESMENLRKESTQLLTEDNPSYNTLQTMKETLERVLATCTKTDFKGKELMEYYYLENILNLCIKLADVEGEVKYLHLIDQDPNRDKEKDVDYEKAKIDSEYGPLHIRFENIDDVEEMATLKTEYNDEVTINILPPVNAWMKLNVSERKKRIKRLNFIKNQSREGKLKVYFDNYDSNEKLFYFVLPYVPYLKQSNSSDDWYAITFDGKKRYRINFYSSQKTPLIIQPEEEWRLEVSTPEKWVKISINDPKISLKFKDRQSERRLTESEYIQIVKENNVDYYLPSDRNIDIEYPAKGASLWNTMNKVLYGSLSSLLIYFIYTGTS